MRHEYCAEYRDVLLRPLHRYDIGYLREWRNQESISRYLTPAGNISRSRQEAWFDEYIRNGDVLFFCADYRRMRTAGTVALSGLKDGSCEIGKLVVGEKAARGNGLGRLSFLMAMCIGSRNMGITEYTLTVNEKNAAAVHIYQKLGFRITGSRMPAWGGTELEMSVLFGDVCRNSREADQVMLFMENEKAGRKPSGGGVFKEPG